MDEKYEGKYKSVVHKQKQEIGALKKQVRELKSAERSNLAEFSKVASKSPAPQEEVKAEVPYVALNKFGGSANEEEQISRLNEVNAEVDKFESLALSSYDEVEAQLKALNDRMGEKSREVEDVIQEIHDAKAKKRQFPPHSAQNAVDRFETFEDHTEDKLRAIEEMIQDRGQLLLTEESKLKATLKRLGDKRGKGLSASKRSSKQREVKSEIYQLDQYLEKERTNIETKLFVVKSRVAREIETQL